MDLVFATGNKNKMKEIQKMLPETIELRTLKDIGCHEEIPETAKTLEGNAQLKSSYVKEKYGLNCFGEDTGLEVEALEGEPGVYSARYAGLQKSAEDNMTLLLQKLHGIENRKARFRTVISLILDDKEFQFEGIVNGRIAMEKSGSDGFGYDPIFIPDGFDITFAEMPVDGKNKISHRGRAVAKLVEYLKGIG